MTNAKIAVVDDESYILEAWVELLGSDYDVTPLSDPFVARRYLKDHPVDLVLLDIRMPGMSGLELLEHIKALPQAPEVILVSGHGTVETAVQGLKDGAFDYMCKPIDNLDEAVRRIDAALERKRLKDISHRLLSSAPDAPVHGLVGESEPMRRVHKMIHAFAAAQGPVLVLGESGAGKELVAKALHEVSPRKDAPFVAVNCAAIPESLIDSELFGHKKGSFTGADTDHDGLFAAANGGTLFLDEIGDVPLQTQVRLLRALQEGQVRPVGAAEPIAVDVRVVAATNVDLAEAIRKSEFREDLYYRLCTFQIDLPSLRERPTDIPRLALHLIERLGRQNPVKAFSEEAMSIMMGHNWPGNVRELANVVEHAAAMCSGDHIDVQHLPPSLCSKQKNPRSSGEKMELERPYAEARQELVESFEKRYLKELVVATEGNLSEASRRSGIDRSNLRRMLKRNEINYTRLRAH